MNRLGLVKNASLQIKDAGNHIIDTSGAIFVVISQKDEMTGLTRKTHQMAYISPHAEDIGLSCEAMESLKLVANLDDIRKASVHLVSNSLSPVVKEEAPGVSGSSLHISQRFESTPADEGASAQPWQCTQYTGSECSASWLP